MPQIDIFLTVAMELLHWEILLLLLFGSALGIVIGAIPGLTVNMAVALAIPFTMLMGPTASIVLLLSLYCAGIYGGSIPAIMVNAPGTPASAATTLDGYPMSQQGRAGKALRISIIASLYGGLFSTVVLIFLAPQLAGVGLRFGPTETAALILFSLTIVSSLSGPSVSKGILAAALGMVIATIGLDPMLAIPRFTFGQYDLADGVPLLPLLIGLFAISEMFIQSENAFRQRMRSRVDRVAAEQDLLTWQEAQSCIKPIVRSGIIGTFLGILPGLGSSVATFMGYADAKRTSPNPEAFGKGAIQGVAASEAANNSVTGAALIPLLALSIPGDTVTAILFGALLIQGITPGPMIFTSRPDVVYTIYITLIMANIAFAAVAYLAIGHIKRLLLVPKVFLYPIILVMCVAGAYAIRSNVFDLYVMLSAGIAGYICLKFAIPLAPLLIAFILATPLEQNLRQALIGSDGNLLVFLQRPISAGLIALTVGSVAVMVLRAFRKR